MIADIMSFGEQYKCAICDLMEFFRLSNTRKIHHQPVFSNEITISKQIACDSHKTPMITFIFTEFLQK